MGHNLAWSAVLLEFKHNEFAFGIECEKIDIPAMAGGHLAVDQQQTRIGNANVIGKYFLKLLLTLYSLSIASNEAGVGESPSFQNPTSIGIDHAPCIQEDK